MVNSDIVRHRRDSGNDRQRGGSRVVHVCIWLLLFVCGYSGFAQVQREDGKVDSKWETLQGCRLVTNAVVDGDSFHLLHGGREYIFRLYFVDSPERDAALKDRIKDQAAYFGIAKEDIPQAGLLASQFTREKLAGTEFTVITRWQNAMGRSSLARFYGVVQVNGANLAEELVANGFARIHGVRANWPDGPRSTTFTSKLKNLELTARGKKRGIWDDAVFHLETDEAISDATTNTTALATPTSPTVMDVNTATFEQLQKLPGIGPKLAERIIAHRPFKTIADLDHVPGIGLATFKRLEPLIRVASPAP